MPLFSRRGALTALTALTALALTACGNSAGGGMTGPSSSGPALTDIVIGSADAPVTLTEYASWTCSHCLQFHQDVMPMLKSDYIETGKVKLVFREFPTPPVNAAVSGFMLARCSGAEAYPQMLDDLFAAQGNILQLAQTGGDIDSAMRAFGKEKGFSEAAYDDCLANEDVRNAFIDAVTKGDAQGVNSTPTMFIDGVRLQGYDWRTADGMKALLDAKLTPEPAE